jgi:hypothetical protein
LQQASFRDSPQFAGSPLQLGALPAQTPARLALATLAVVFPAAAELWAVVLPHLQPAENNRTRLITGTGKSMLARRNLGRFSPLEA